MAEEYTPTTWANGDAVTAAALNNIEQGIANAGGGSSDFSTAQVTITNNTSAQLNINGAFAIEAGDEIPAYSWHDAFYELNETRTENFVLYKGVGGIEITGLVEPSISGNIESVGDGVYLVTGDCTITISDKIKGGL